MDYGFVNSSDRMAQVIAWREAAVADGWTIEPTYGDHESVDRAWELKREGWSVQGLTRVNEQPAKWNYQASIHVWAPDGLAVDVPDVYNMQELVRLSRKCAYCNTEDVDTQRVGFAGRCCTMCLPEMRWQIETRGWAD